MKCLLCIWYCHTWRLSFLERGMGHIGKHNSYVFMQLFSSHYIYMLWCDHFFRRYRWYGHLLCLIGWLQPIDDHCTKISLAPFWKLSCHWTFARWADFYTLRLTICRFKCPSQPLTVKVSPSHRSAVVHNVLAGWGRAREELMQGIFSMQVLILFRLKWVEWAKRQSYMYVFIKFGNIRGVSKCWVLRIWAWHCVTSNVQ
jgi:hypothetical protein